MGRNKDSFWQYVDTVKNEKRKCKFCGHQFAGGATRIKAHLSGIENKGIDACRQVPEKVRRAAASTFKDANRVNSNNRLSHPQENLINLGSPSGTSGDSYRSKETILEQATYEEVDMKRKITWCGENQVGPFFISKTIDARDSQLIEYVFDLSRDKGEIIVSFLRFHLSRAEFVTLRPKALLSSTVIDIFSEYLTEIERKKKNMQLNWYLPLMFSTSALCGDLRSFDDFVKHQNIRESYMSKLVNCEEMFIPVHKNKNSTGHFFLYVIHLKNREVEIWDPLPSFLKEEERGETTQELLFALDFLFMDDLRDIGSAFRKFHVAMAKSTPVQPNEYDCGIFVINFMQQLANVSINSSLEFHSDEERLSLALTLLKSDFNNQREALYNKVAQQNYAQGDEDGNLSKRKRIDIPRYPEDVREKSGTCNSPNGPKKGMQLQRHTGHIKGYPLLATDLIGEQFQIYTDEIWEWLKEDEVSTIGVWGMGGVGKTALITHIHNRLLERDDVGFDHVIWVTVSQHYSVNQLQKFIAEAINLDISHEQQEKRIAGRLLDAFKHINKCVLILDDVWDHIFLDEVGFPISNNGNKLVLTTRSLDMCRSMNCKKNIIKIKPLDEKGAWNLFEKTFEENGMFSYQIKDAARLVVKECFGLPLAIDTIARSMKGKEDIREWKHMSQSLRKSPNEQSDMHKWVFPILRSSYDNLNNKKLQECFLHYALDFDPDRDFDFESFVSKGLMDGTKTLEENFYEFQGMLNKLTNNSLIDNTDREYLHQIIGHMAIGIAKETNKVMVNSNQGLTEIPEEDEWREDLQKVFLMDNDIRDIPHGTSPRCPNLSTFLLRCNDNLKSIPDYFFVNMTSLRVLNLSHTGILRLPKSVSNLECLVTLWLDRCRSLRHVPSLAKLRKLMWLSLYGTAITEVPQGLEMLFNLRWLDLRETPISFDFTKLTKLQCLHLNCLMDVKAQDLLRLKRLESVSAHFYDITEFTAYADSFRQRSNRLFSYHLGMGTGTKPYGQIEGSGEKVIEFVGSELECSDIVLPTDVNKLIITKYNYGGSRCLCDFLSFYAFIRIFEIESCNITGCDSLNFLFCMSASCCRFCPFLQLVGSLVLRELTGLRALIMDSLDLGTPQWFLGLPSLLPITLFYHLKHLIVYRCNALEKLLTPELSAQFQNLEEIEVKSCQSMKEIFSIRSIEQEYEQLLGEGNRVQYTITLPRLRSIYLRDLPELHFVCNGIMICDSLSSWAITGCNNLKSLPEFQPRHTEYP